LLFELFKPTLNMLHSPILDGGVSKMFLLTRNRRTTLQSNNSVFYPVGCWFPSVAPKSAFHKVKNQSIENRKKLNPMLEGGHLLTIVEPHGNRTFRFLYLVGYWFTTPRIEISIPHCKGNVFRLQSSERLKPIYHSVEIFRNIRIKQYIN